MIHLALMIGAFLFLCWCALFAVGILAALWESTSKIPGWVLVCGGLAVIMVLMHLGVIPDR